MKRLRTRRAHELIAQDHLAQPRWLIEDLWAEQGVGIVGGEPKCCKSFLALDMAVAVAGAVPCLGKFAVPRAGRVLLFAAEDSLPVVRARLEGIAAAAGGQLEQLDIHVITEPELRIDRDHDAAGLTCTVQELRPRLLILDPFVRMHRIDENHSGEVAPLLGYLRNLQRALHLAVIVVHHAKKGGGRGRAGQELRGSSEFHAWGDSNLYLRRRKERLLLCTEHRAAPGQDELELKLEQHGDSLALRIQEPPPEHGPDATATEPASTQHRIMKVLQTAEQPMTGEALRGACRVRTQTLGQVLRSMVDSGELTRTGTGYQLSRR